MENLSAVFDSVQIRCFCFISKQSAAIWTLLKYALCDPYFVQVRKTWSIHLGEHDSLDFSTNTCVYAAIKTKTLANLLTHKQYRKSLYVQWQTLKQRTNFIS